MVVERKSPRSNAVAATLAAVFIMLSVQSAAAAGKIALTTAVITASADVISSVLDGRKKATDIGRLEYKGKLDVGAIDANTSFLQINTLSVKGLVADTVKYDVYAKIGGRVTTEAAWLKINAAELSGNIDDVDIHAEMEVRSTLSCRYSACWINSLAVD